MVTSVQTDPSYTPSAESIMPLHNGQTGELMKNIPAPYSLRLRRKKWLEMLIKDIDIKVSRLPISNAVFSLHISGANASGLLNPVKAVSL